MSAENPGENWTNEGGQEALVFLTREYFSLLPDLYRFSQAFLAYHKDEQHKDLLALPYDHGVISSMNQLDADGKRTRPPHESIAFDARNPEEFVWDLNYADSGVQHAARLWVTASETRGLAVRTNRQGGVVERFELTPRRAHSVELFLLERLNSPEVQKAMQATYQRRISVKEGSVNLVNNRSDEDAKYARGAGIPVENVPPSEYYQHRIEAQKQLLKVTGFLPMMIFNESWLKDQNT